MIDTKELRQKITTRGLDVVADTDVLELLDRLEAAEEERDRYKLAYNDWIAKTEWLRHEIARSSLPAKYLGMHRADAIKLEIDRLRARVAEVAEMEKQEPVAWMLNCQTLGGDTGWILSWTQSGAGLCDRLPGTENEKKLYALPGAHAQPAPSMPVGWLRAIDEALVVTHLGVANADDSYEAAKRKLDNLIGWHTDVATDPAVNGGFKFVPIDPTQEMLDAGEDTFFSTYTGTPTSTPIDVYNAMLAAAPEAKP